MKKILIGAICVVMCCTFFTQYVAAATIVDFTCSSISIITMYTINKTTGVPVESSSNNKNGVPVSGTSNSFTFSTIQSYARTFNTNYVSYGFDINGSWSESNIGTDYNWFSVDLGLNIIGNDTVRFNTSQFVNCYKSMRFFCDTGVYDVPVDLFSFIGLTDSSYRLMIYVDQQFLHDLTTATKIELYVPYQLQGTGGTPNYTTNFGITFSNIQLEYSLPDNSTVIIENLGSIQDKLDNILIQNQTQIDEIILTKEAIQQLPDNIADKLINADLGTADTTPVDTTDLKAYEDQLEIVEQYIKVDDVNAIFKDGISFDGGDNYSSGSLSSLSEFMTRIITVTGLDSLIVICLTLGTASFILGRTRYLK